MKTSAIFTAVALAVSQTEAFKPVSPKQIISILHKVHFITHSVSPLWQHHYGKNGGAFGIPGGRLGNCGVPGKMCYFKRGLEEVGACGAPGHPCNTIKRAAHAIAAVLDEADETGSKEPSFCNVEGQPCHEANKYLGEIAEKTRRMYADVYANEADSVAHAEAHNALDSFCSGSDANCQRGDHVGNLEVDPEAFAAFTGHLGVYGEHGTPGLVGRHNSPGASKYGWIDFYSPPGPPSNEKRRANPKKAKGMIGWCGPPGMFCGRHDKRGLQKPEGKCGANGIQCHIGPEAMDRVRKDPSQAAELRACGPNGTPCLITHDASADPKYNPFSKIGYCGTPGAACSGDVAKRTAEPEPFCPSTGPCLSGRDAQIMAHHDDVTGPTPHKQQCHRPGGSCFTIKKIQKLFHGLRRDADAVLAEGLNDSAAHAKRCTADDGFCSVVAKKHTVDKRDMVDDVVQEASQAAAACKGSDGLCQALRGELDDLLATIDNAVEATK